MISKIWPGLSLAIIAILAFLWLRNGCNNPSVADSTQKVMDALKSGWDSARRQDLPAISRLTIKSDSLGQQLAEEKKRRTAVEGSLLVRKSDLLKTLAALQAARTSHDTAGQVLQGDTLEAQVISGIPAVEGFVRLTDSMINACEAQVAIKDSLIFFKDKLLGKADVTITAQQLQFDIIHKDDVKKTAQLKFYRPLAIGGVTAAAILIVLKFIVH